MKRKRVWEWIAAISLVAGLAAAYLPCRMLYELWEERRQEALAFRYAVRVCSVTELRAYSSRGRNTSEARWFARRGQELLVAAAIGDVAWTQELLAWGADPNQIVGYGASVDSRPGRARTDPIYASRTALHWATVNGDLETARILVQAGADLNARDSTGETPLDVARSNSHPDIARMLQSAVLKRAAAGGRRSAGGSFRTAPGRG